MSFDFDFFLLQATIFFPKAYLSLYLPISVSNSVSDIWRGYIIEALSKSFDFKVGFLPRPMVSRNKENDLAKKQKFEDELELYEKTEGLIELLRNWQETKIPGNTLLLIEDLWIELYEHAFVSLKEVQAVQLWLISLVELGHASFSFKGISNGLQQR